MLCMMLGTTAWADNYELLTSIADIDESAEYVLGVEDKGFHYSGTSSWGLCALPTAQTPIYYTLTKASDGSSFTASANINGKTYYLQIPTTNTFSMADTTGTNTDIIIGTTKVAETNYAVANKQTTDRHLRINGTSGLRSYASTTVTMAYSISVLSQQYRLFRSLLVQRLLQSVNNICKQQISRMQQGQSLLIRQATAVLRKWMLVLV